MFLNPLYKNIGAWLSEIKLYILYSIHLNIYNILHASAIQVGLEIMTKLK